MDMIIFKLIFLLFSVCASAAYSKSDEKERAVRKCGVYLWKIVRNKDKLLYYYCRCEAMSTISNIESHLSRIFRAKTFRSIRTARLFGQYQFLCARQWRFSYIIDGESSSTLSERYVIWIWLVLNFAVWPHYCSADWNHILVIGDRANSHTYIQQHGNELMKTGESFTSSAMNPDVPLKINIEITSGN